MILTTEQLAIVSRVRREFRDGTARQRRVGLKLSRAEVARACGVTPWTYGAWERGDYTPLADSALRVAELFEAVTA